jgi:hypothetical protein
MGKETSLFSFFICMPMHPSVHATNLINPLHYKYNTGFSAFSYPTLGLGILIGISFHVIRRSITLRSKQLLIIYMHACVS